MIQAERGALPAEGESDVAGIFGRIKQGFKGRPEELIPLLQNVQRALGFLPEETLMEIARFIRLPAARVYGTVTFYSQFRLKPVGKYMVRVCRGTACHVKGSDRILDDVQANEESDVASGLSLNVAELLPANKSYYHYLGSLTTPPLTENVEWYVMANFREDFLASIPAAGTR